MCCNRARDGVHLGLRAEVRLRGGANVTSVVLGRTAVVVIPKLKQTCKQNNCKSCTGPTLD